MPKEYLQRLPESQAKVRFRSESNLHIASTAAIVSAREFRHMKRLHIYTVVLMLSAQVSAQQAPTVQETESALRKALDAVATRQQAGGWGNAYTRDGVIMWGEWKPVPQTWITVQPPATPTVAGVYLRAAQVLDDPALAQHAQHAREALLRLQTEAGGFPHEGDPAGPRPKVATFDDSVTTAALDFFIDWWRYTKADEDRRAVDQVGAFLLESQYESGGWPQAYPPASSGYARHITFNDGVMAEAIRALLRLHRELDDPRYLEAAKRAGDCSIRLQGGPGEAIWAQQYDRETFEPAWARAFEPPGYSAAESIGACEILIELFRASGDEKYLAPLPKAFEWYDTHRLENGKWARLYEPGTQRPVYGRRDKPEKVYNFEDACEGYAWQAAWYPAGAKATYEAIQQAGPQAWLSEQKARPEPATPVPPPAQVREVIDQLAAESVWVDSPSSAELEEYVKYQADPAEPMVRMSTFCSNSDLLLDYIETHKQAPDAASTPEGDTP
jgi:PelA/Pel-15E family pectate lyase